MDAHATGRAVRPAPSFEPSLNIVERTLLLLEVAPFRALTSEELAELASKMTELHFEAGEVVFADGDAEGRLCIVVDGAVDLTHGETSVRRATRGIAFGIFGLLGIPADETARAAESTCALALAREDFVDALADNQAFAVGCLRGLALMLQALLRRVEALEKSATSQDR